MKSSNSLVKIDGIDKKILRFLMTDARKPILEIARKIGISGAAIHQRLRKLEASGLLSGSNLWLIQKFWDIQPWLILVFFWTRQCLILELFRL